MEVQDFDDMTVREAAAVQLSETTTTGTIEVIMPPVYSVEIIPVEAPPPPTPTRDGRHHKYAPRPATSHIWYDEPADAPVVPRMSIFSRAQKIGFMVATHLAVAVGTFATLTITVFPQIA